MAPPADSEGNQQLRASGVDGRLNEIQREGPWQGPPGRRPEVVIKLILVYVPTSAEVRAGARVHSPKAPGVCHNYREEYISELTEPHCLGPKGEAQIVFLFQEMHILQTCTCTRGHLCGS